MPPPRSVNPVVSSRRDETGLIGHIAPGNFVLGWSGFGEFIQQALLGRNQQSVRALQADALAAPWVQVSLPSGRRAA